LVLLSTASLASAAVDLSNTLTGFTGNSTQAATVTALSNAGFNFSDFDPLAVVNFDSGGMHVNGANNVGRNYLRTNDTDYANRSFVAEITIITPNIDIQDAYVGLGAGFANPDFFRTPDNSSPFASALYWGENEVATPTMETYSLNNGLTESVGFLDPAPGLVNGTHRLRMTYDWFQKRATFSFDLNYAGGAFAADITAPAVSTVELYGADGWPTEPARIYFGGDEGVTFRDFSVDVTTPNLILGDFNSTGTVTGADWAILRDNLHSNVSSLSFEQAYFLGDVTADKAINHADFVRFKTVYEELNGSGSFALMLAGVPEPSTAVSLLVACLLALAAGRRANRA
jgi:hypothetical protein